MTRLPVKLCDKCGHPYSGATCPCAAFAEKDSFDLALQKQSRKIEELETENKQLKNEGIEIIHNLSADNDVLKSKVAKLEAKIKEFIKDDRVSIAVLLVWQEEFKQFLEKK